MEGFVSLFRKTGSSHKVEEITGEWFPCKTRMYYEPVKTVKASNFHSDASFFRPLQILWFGIGSCPQGEYAEADEVGDNSEPQYKVSSSHLVLLAHR